MQTNGSWEALEWVNPPWPTFGPVTHISNNKKERKKKGSSPKLGYSLLRRGIQGRARPGKAYPGPA